MAEPEPTNEETAPGATPQEREDQPQQIDQRRGGELVSRMHSIILRERVEPRDGYEPVPLWLVGLFGLLIFWGGWYLAEYSGGWSSEILNPHPSARFPAVAATDGPVDPMVIGQKLYTAHCVSCHQQNAQGVEGQYPPLAGSPWVLENPQRLKRILLQGLEGNVTVLSRTYNGNMAAFGARLNDERLAAVLTYIRRSFGNTADPIAPESVAATREATKDRTKPWSEAELLAITEPDYTAPPPDETPPPKEPEKK